MKITDRRVLIPRVIERGNLTEDDRAFLRRIQKQSGQTKYTAERRRLIRLLTDYAVTGPDGRFSPLDVCWAPSLEPEPLSAPSLAQDTSVATITPLHGMTARLYGSGDQYSVRFAGNLIVTNSRDPECDAARALKAMGVTGKLTMLDGVTGMPRTIINIEKAALYECVEGKNGPRFRKVQTRIAEAA
jgi:hypothetical protein